MTGIYEIDASGIDYSKLSIDLVDQQPDLLVIHNVDIEDNIDYKEIVRMQTMLWCLDGHKLNILLKVD